MSLPRKLLVWVAGCLAGLCLLVLVAGLAVVRSAWFREQVRARIVREVETATGGRTEIREFRFDWSRMTAEVRGFILHGTEPAGEPPLVTADSVEVGLKIISALRRDVDIQSLAVRGPRVRIVVGKDGRTNLPQPKVARSPRRPVERLLALAIDRFAVESGAVEINDRRFPLELRGERLASRLDYEAAGPRYTGDVSFRRLRVAALELLPFATDADLSLSLEGNRLVVREGRFRTDRSSAAISGVVEDLVAPRVDLAIQARLSLAEVQALAKTGNFARGTVDLKGELKYSGLSGYGLDARVSGTGLSASIGGMQLTDVRLSSGLKAIPGSVELPGLQVGALGGEFAGSAGVEKLRVLHVAGDVRGLRVSDLAALRGLAAPPWDGIVSGPLTLDASIASGGLYDADLAGRFTIDPAGAARPLTGQLNVSLNQRLKTVQFDDSLLSTGASRVEFSGALDERLRVNLHTRDLADLLPLGAYINDSFPREIPVALRNGEARFTGELTGGLDAPHVSGHASLTNFSYRGHAFDRLEADVSLDEAGVAADKLSLEQGEARLQGQGRATLERWKFPGTSRVSGAFSVRTLPLERIAAESGGTIAVHGLATGAFQVGGTLAEPQVSGKLAVSQAEALGRRFREVRLQGRYADRSLTLESFDLDTGAGLFTGDALYTHQPENLRRGFLRFNVSTKSLSLALLRPTVSLPETTEGVVDGQFRGTASIENATVLLTDLRGKASTRQLSWKGKTIGDVSWTAATEAGALAVEAEGEAFGMKVKAASQIALQGDYPMRGEVSFSRVTLAGIAPWLKLAGVSSPPVEASADGRVYLSGLLRKPDTLTARIEMPGVEVLPAPIKGAVAPRLRNQGLVVLAVSRKAARVVSAYFSGPDTNLEVTGGVDLATRFNAYDLRVRGTINLNILHSFDAGLAASGDSTVDANIRGRLSSPEFYGRLEFRQAALNLANMPNGVENANGVILFYRDRATIESLTAETGGGKVSVRGYVGLGGPQLTYRLQATASKVRVRYPQGVSTSLDGAVDLTGTTERSLLSGTVTVLRSGVSPGVDMAGLLSRASQPMVTQATTNDLLRGMQFDLRVVTAADARFDTMITRELQAEAEMRLRGTPYKPVLLGRVTISQGEVIFLGNSYTISRGEISFLNPVRLEPILKVDLETRVRGIDVTMSLTGPADRLNLGFRSEPPLQYQEILALLAVGRAPTSDPTLLARQTQQDQSWQQAGASTLVGQALAAPVAGRLQRFFGVSRIKIDPKLTGLGNSPEAQITLEQQISKDITFTYVTNLAQEQQQLIRVEWNVSRQWSVLAVREENGLFGVEFQFRKQFK